MRIQEYLSCLQFFVGLLETRRLAEVEIYLWLEDTSKVAAVTVGVVSLLFLGRKILVLEDCLYVPNVRKNLISVSSLSCNGFSAIFNKNFVSVKYDADEICCGMLIDSLYIIELISHLQVNSIESNHKRKKPSSYFIWSNQKDPLQRVRNRKCASCKSLFMDLSRHLSLGTSNLTNRSSHLDLSNILMKFMCIRGVTKMWWYFSYFM